MGRDAKRERPDEARRRRRFGPSKAVVQVAPGQTEAQVLSVMRSLLGRPRATLRDAASLAGSPDDARVTVAVIPRHGRWIIEVAAENPLIRIKVLLHTRPDGKPLLVDELIDVAPVAQRQGLGTQFLGRQVEQAVRLGIVEIQAYAIRGDQGGDVGYRVWPILGFDGTLPRETLDKLPPELAAARKISDLMETREGREWWIRDGSDIDLTFDLSANSPARRRLRAYLRRKGFP
jgi:GNAT superfamily N-acetyltransferase